MEHDGYGDFRARREATIWQRLNRVLRVLLVIAFWLVIVSSLRAAVQETDSEPRAKSTICRRR